MPQTRVRLTSPCASSTSFRALWGSVAIFSLAISRSIEGNEPLLGTVVQVAFDSAAFGDGCFHCPRAALGQFLHVLSEPRTLAGPEECPTQGSVSFGHADDEEIPKKRGDRQGNDRDD